VTNWAATVPGLNWTEHVRSYYEDVKEFLARAEFQAEALLRTELRSPSRRVFLSPAQAVRAWPKVEAPVEREELHEAAAQRRVRPGIAPIGTGRAETEEASSRRKEVEPP